jgi:tRNA G18 (ribose-2'-O)-methylase SpoU
VDLAEKKNRKELLEQEMERIWKKDGVPVLVDPAGLSIAALRPAVVVDAILAKKNLGTTKEMAPFVIALGPGFTAGEDVDVVIETKRGHNLGRVIRSGSAVPNTGIPGIIGGYGKERVMHAQAEGILRNAASIGDIVEARAVIAEIETENGTVPVEASLSGLLRGDRTHLLIVESIQDPGNLGTMLRTGEGAGITGIIMNRTTVDLFNPKTIRSTMGSIYRVPYYIADDLAETIGELKRQKVGIYAAHLKGQMQYDEPSYCKGTAFLIGNEGNGLSDEIAGLADTYVRIPMEGSVESLNAAVSAALLMYETNRQRRRKGK